MFGLITFDEGFRQLAAARPRIGKPHVLYCLDLYQQPRGRPTCPAGRADVAAAIAGHLRKTSLVPVISDFLFADAPRLIQRAVDPERGARCVPHDGGRAFRVPACRRVGRLDPDASTWRRAARGRLAPGIRAAGGARRRVAAGPSSERRATPISTSCGSASIVGRWRRRSWSSSPSGGCEKCEVMIIKTASSLRQAARRGGPSTAGGRGRRRRARGAPAWRRRRPPASSMDPIKCWWRTDTSAVMSASASRSRSPAASSRPPWCGRAQPEALDPGALPLTPVRGGRRHPPRRHRGAALALFPVRVRRAAGRQRVLRAGRRYPVPRRRLQHRLDGDRNGGAGAHVPAARDCRCGSPRSFPERPPTSGMRRRNRSAPSRRGAFEQIPSWSPRPSRPVSPRCSSASAIAAGDRPVPEAPAGGSPSALAARGAGRVRTGRSPAEAGNGPRRLESGSCRAGAGRRCAWRAPLRWVGPSLRRPSSRTRRRARDRSRCEWAFCAGASA